MRNDYKMLSQVDGHGPPGEPQHVFRKDVDVSKPRQRNPSGSCLRSPRDSPPSSPDCKKSVRFADSIGMELEAIRMVEKYDHDINLPNSFVKSVLRSRRYMDRLSVNRVSTEKYLEPCFELPDTDIMNRVGSNKACLESFTVDNLSVTATVRVANIAFEKSVVVRFSITDWDTHYDLPARYVESLHNTQSDRFTFEISLPRDFVIGCRLEFALQYRVGGQTYWDNNNEENYAFECTDTRRTTMP
ncbi:protein phosphatase 1 regulatory subunit 3C-B-like [Glandiceps talaboti]